MTKEIQKRIDKINHQIQVLTDQRSALRVSINGGRIATLKHTPLRTKCIRNRIRDPYIQVWEDHEVVRSFEWNGTAKVLKEMKRRHPLADIFLTDISGNRFVTVLAYDKHGKKTKNSVI